MENIYVVTYGLEIEGIYESWELAKKRFDFLLNLPEGLPLKVKIHELKKGFEKFDNATLSVQ